jgi:hypothetical protein
MDFCGSEKKYGMSLSNNIEILGEILCASIDDDFFLKKIGTFKAYILMNFLNSQILA